MKPMMPNQMKMSPRSLGNPTNNRILEGGSLFFCSAWRCDGQGRRCRDPTCRWRGGTSVKKRTRTATPSSLNCSRHSRIMYH